MRCLGLFANCWLVVICFKSMLKWFPDEKMGGVSGSASHVAGNIRQMRKWVVFLAVHHVWLVMYVQRCISCSSSLRAKSTSQRCFNAAQEYVFKITWANHDWYVGLKWWNNRYMLRMKTKKSTLWPFKQRLVLYLFEIIQWRISSEFMPSSWCARAEAWRHWVMNYGWDRSRHLEGDMWTSGCIIHTEKHSLHNSCDEWCHALDSLKHPGQI